MLVADHLDDFAEGLYTLPEPGELVLGDAIMFGVARLDVGFLELLEPRPVSLGLARPDLDQARIDPLRLRPQETEVVDVRGVEGADQKNAVIIAFRRLVEFKRSVLQQPLLNCILC